MASFWNKRLINKAVLYSPSSPNGFISIDSSIQQWKGRLLLPLSTFHIPSAFSCSVHRNLDIHFIYPLLFTFVYSWGATFSSQLPGFFFFFIVSFLCIRCSVIESKIKIQRKESTDLICNSETLPLTNLSEDYPRAKFLYCNVRFCRLIVCRLLEHTGTRRQFIILPQFPLLNRQVLVNLTFARV